MTRQIHLWAFLQGIGHYPSGWRHAGADPAGVFSMDYYRQVGELCERGKFDAIVYGDQLQSRGAGGRTPERLAMPTLDPISLLAAIGSVTHHIGLVATVSTTYNAPLDLAERFATLDRITGGRAGWNIVTTAHPASAPNFGDPDLPEKSQRYARAAETVAAACKLWDNPGSAVKFRGQFLELDETLSTMPLPQGRPVLVQAGQSGDGRDFAAHTAEAIFCPAATIDAGIAFRTDMRSRIAAVGRDPDGVRIMPGLSFILAPSVAEAVAKDEALLALANEALCIEYLCESLVFDLTPYDPAGPIPVTDIVAGTLLPPQDIARTVQPPADEGLSLGAFAARYVRTPRGHNVFRGTPRQLADQMIEWIDAGACDGFTLQPAYMPGELALFVDEVVPLLQQAGRLRTAYPGSTLRATLGLSQ